MAIDNFELVYRLVLAALLGGLIGFERETHGRAAGLRTHILVCIGSALIMLISFYCSFASGGTIACDPTRIAAGVITGLGFLGGGTILRFKASVRGLTTAASLWTAGAIGLAIGAGFYKAAYAATILVLITLVGFAKLERLLTRKGWFKKLPEE